MVIGSPSTGRGASLRAGWRRCWTGFGAAEAAVASAALHPRRRFANGQAPARARRSRRAPRQRSRGASTSIARSSAGANGCVSGVGVQPADRPVELVEGELVHRLRDLGADAAHRLALVDDEQAVRLPDALGDGLDVERHDACGGR